MPLFPILLAPEIGGLFVGLLAVCAAIFLLGLSQAHSAVHGSRNTGGFWQWIESGGPIRDLLGWGLQAARWVVSRFAASQLGILTRFFRGMGTLTLGTFGIQAWFAEQVVSAIERVMHRGDPRARSKAATANRHAIHAGHVAHAAGAHSHAVGRELHRYKAHTNAQVHHLTHATTIALPRDIAREKHRERWAEKQLWKVRDRVIGLENGAIKTFEWLRDHPGSAAVGAFTGAIAAVLSWPAVNALR